MEVIAFNEKLEELYPLDIDVDFEVGDSSARNDFEIVSSELREYGIYIPGTEFGGVIEYDENPSYQSENTLRGWSWRGLLSQWIIEPDEGNDYKIVSGEMNVVIRELLSNVLGGFFCVPEVDSGIEVEGFQFKLHCKVLDGLMDLVSAYGGRLKIYAGRTVQGTPIRVFCEFAPAQKVVGTYDEDTGLQLTFTNNQMGINHLICWGSGQLQQRQRLDLFLDEDGNIGEEQYYFGFQERQAVYEYSGVESLDELRKGGIERLKELASGKKLQIDDVDGNDLEIGDIVVGRKNELGLIIEKPITRKILRISGGKESIEYKVKGEG